MSMLSTAISGLMVQQEALKTTGHNISNVSTPGYSRQEVVVESNSPLFRGFGYIGQGVDVSTVRRVHDEFLTSQLRSDTSGFFDVQAFRDNIEQVDRVLADDRTGLQPQMDRYFAALQGAADNPGYIPSRDVVLGEAKGMEDRFAAIAGYLSSQNETLNGQLETMAAEVNSLAIGITELNERIVGAQGSTTTAPPNDLLDKRDELVRQLSELVEVDVLEVGGSLNITIAKGQSLVQTFEANQLVAAGGREDPHRFGIHLVSKFENLDISADLKGGQIGGSLAFREQALDLAVNSLGRIAATFVQQTNTQHRLGTDMNGSFGKDFFKDLNDPSLTGDRVFAYSDNALPNDRIFSVYFDDTSQLTASEYTLALPGPSHDRFEVTRKDDGKVVQSGALNGEYPQEIAFDGLRVVLEAGSFAEGDGFTVAPLRQAAEDVSFLVQNPADIALAYPIKAETSLSNTGSGLIDQGQMLTRDGQAFAVDGELSPPMLVRFESATRYSILDNTDPGNPVPLTPPLQNLEFISGAGNTLFSGDPGETVVSSWRALLPDNAAVGVGGVGTGSSFNGINPERFYFSQTDAQTGKTTELAKVSTTKGASAASIAQQLNQVDGVVARAYTEVHLTNFSSAVISGSSPDPSILPEFNVFINGFELTQSVQTSNQTTYMDGFPEVVPSDLTPNFLADRINSHWELSRLGITAKSDGEQLTINDINGNDILVEMTGNKAQDFITGSSALPSGQTQNNNFFVEQPDSFEISTGETWPIGSVAGDTRGMINNLSGYDFEVGGPYEYQMYLPDGRTGTINLDADYLNGEALRQGVTDKIAALLNRPEHRVDVAIDEKGELSYQIFMTMKGQGSTDSSRVNIGGELDIVMASGVSFESDPDVGGIFNGVPQAQSSYYGFQFELSGTPDGGDEFSIGWNTNGVSDNRNALDLVALQVSDTIRSDEGSRTFNESYSRTVSQIGTLTSQVQIRSDAARAVMEGSQAEINAVHGVNLDEEAARLIEFQAAYNANAKVISIAQELFNSLLASL
jgi:flagellar hook-associated protein 1 FlgK